MFICFIVFVCNFPFFFFVAVAGCCIARSHCLHALLYFLPFFARILAVFMRFIRSRSHYAQSHTTCHSDECRRMWCAVHCNLIKINSTCLGLGTLRTITIYLYLHVSNICRKSKHNGADFCSAVVFPYWKCVWAKIIGGGGDLWIDEPTISKQRKQNSFQSYAFRE